MKKRLLNVWDEYTWGAIALLAVLIVIPLLAYATARYLKREIIPSKTVFQAIDERLVEGRRGMLRHDGNQLTHLVGVWRERGSPQGDKLDQFAAASLGNTTIVSNRTFEIGGSNHTSLFAMTHLHYNIGTLFVTTNKVLIYLHPSGEYRFLADDGLLTLRNR